MRYSALFVVIGLLASCTSPEKLITRAWKFKDWQFENVTDSASVAFGQQVREQMKTNIDFSMEADSTYTIWQLKSMEPVRGKWWFSADKKQLFTKTDMGLTQSKVLNLTKNLLVFETKDPSGKMIKMTCVAKPAKGSK